mgnify:CR=1 FL=1
MSVTHSQTGVSILEVRGFITTVQGESRVLTDFDVDVRQRYYSFLGFFPWTFQSVAEIVRMVCQHCAMQVIFFLFCPD